MNSSPIGEAAAEVALLQSRRDAVEWELRDLERRMLFALDRTQRLWARYHAGVDLDFLDVVRTQNAERLEQVRLTNERRWLDHEIAQAVARVWFAALGTNTNKEQ